MYRKTWFFFWIVISCLILFGCDSSPVEEAFPLSTISPAVSTNTLLPTTVPSITSTQTLLPTATNTPRPTQTPKPEVKIWYSLQVNEPETGVILVTGRIENYSNSVLYLGRGESGGGRQVPPLINFTPSYSTATIHRFLEVIKIEKEVDEIVEFSYSVNLDAGLSEWGDYRWYLNNKFGIVEPEYLFFFPVTLGGEYQSISNIEINVSLPENWEMVTHWNYEYDQYEAHSTADFILGFLGFGNFNLYERQVGEMQVVTAFTGVSASQEERTSEFVFAVYEYFTDTIGDISYSTYIPRDKYILAFVPRIKGEYVISNREAAFGYFTSIDSYEAGISHQIFHEWNSNSGAFFGPSYFVEGFTTFFQYYSLYKLGIWNEGQYLRGLGDEYVIYQNQIQGTQNDIPINQEGNSDWALYYKKGALVALLLNEGIELVSDGNITLEDVMKVVFDQYAIQDSKNNDWYDFDYMISSRVLLEITNSLTGHDFGEFFDFFVYGKEPLPLSLQGGRIQVDENALINVLNLVGE